jgi:hypothetical protein
VAQRFQYDIAALPPDQFAIRTPPHGRHPIPNIALHKDRFDFDVD